MKFTRTFLFLEMINRVHIMTTKKRLMFLHLHSSCWMKTNLKIDRCLHHRWSILQILKPTARYYRVHLISLPVSIISCSDDLQSSSQLPLFLLSLLTTHNPPQLLVHTTCRMFQSLTRSICILYLGFMLFKISKEERAHLSKRFPILQFHYGKPAPKIKMIKS